MEPLFFRICTLIAEVNDPGTKRVRFNQPQFDWVGQRREERRAAAQDDRLDEKSKFIDQTEPHKGRSEGGAAEVYVFAGLLLQLRNLCGDVVFNQPGVPPLSKSPFALFSPLVLADFRLLCKRSGFDLT